MRGSDTDRELLFDMLKELSYEERAEPFTLKSGRKSKVYFDVRETALHAEGASLCAWCLLALIREHAPGVDAVAGVAVGGVPLATAVSLESDAEAADEFAAGRQPLKAYHSMVVRREAKTHGVGGALMGARKFAADLEPGGDGPPWVAVVEDVVTTGGSVLEAAKALIEAGFFVKGIFVVVDREEGAREAIEREGFEFHALFKKSDFGSAT